VKTPEEHDAPASPGPILALIAAAIACIGAVCGIGGGLFATPILHFGFRLALKRAIATSLGLVCATAASATLAEALRSDSALDWSIVAVIVPCALLGAQLGFRVVQRLDTRTLKGIFAIAFAAVAVKLVVSTGDVTPLAGYHPDLLDHLRVALAGLSAGFVVPLLGVGGGLVLVPGVLYCVPELGYQGARATSLAVAVVTASRGLWMHYRAGNLEVPTARWFALGGLLGGAAGVQLVHVDGVAPVGQVLLGAILAVSAVRFSLDWLRGRAAARPDA
jgi:uncharacterized membrane protein YfcA